MPDHVYDWLLESSQGWPAKPLVNKIDTHHHFVTEEYAEAIAKAGGDPSGWPMPRWTPYSSELLMDRLGIQATILSCTSPGACILKGAKSWDLARSMNLTAAKLRNENPGKWGWFVNLADILNTDEALAEITYGMDTLHADGVCLFTRYGTGNAYLGHPDIEPIWKELNRRKAVVFIHPTHPVDLNKVNPMMSQPIVDYPHETTRTAMDMIFQGTLRKHPDCKVILSHGGGTLPYLIARVSTPLRKAPDFGGSYLQGLTYEEFMGDFCRFYYDLALSQTTPNLNMLLEMVPHDHILYGSDFPYPPAPAHAGLIENLEAYHMSSELRNRVNFENALSLFPRLANQRKQHL